MKAIIYAGIGLFSAASVYGVVDYYNTKSKGTLDKMYKEEAQVTESKEEITKISLPPAEVKKETTITNTTVKAGTSKKTKKFKQPIRTVKFSDFSRGRILPPKVIEEAKTVKAVKEGNK